MLPQYILRHWRLGGHWTSGYQEAKNQNIKLSHEWTHEFFANNNDKETVELLREVAEEKGFQYEKRLYPFKWGEDFGLFTHKYKGAMFGIGSGESCPALHNPDYDFPDEIISTAVNMFVGFIDKVMDS